MALTHLGLKFDYETEQDPRKHRKESYPTLLLMVKELQIPS